MTLLADLGGSRLKLARASSPEVLTPLGSRAWPDQALAEDWAWLESRVEGSERVLVSSTRPAALKAWLQHEDWGERLDVVTADRIPLRRETTGTGSDRLLGAWAAWQQAGQACLIVDLGTAWTLDVIDADGVFRGGAIGAGLELQRESLAQACPHLDGPDGSRDAPIPDSTARAVDAGVRVAILAGIEELGAQWERELGSPCQRFLTGGDASAAEVLPEWRRVDDLVLRGLALFADQLAQS